MRNTIRMNSAAMRENTMPTITPAIEDSSRMKPPNGLIAIAAKPEHDAKGYYVTTAKNRKALPRMTSTQKDAFQQLAQ